MSGLEHMATVSAHSGGVKVVVGHVMRDARGWLAWDRLYRPLTVRRFRDPLRAHRSIEAAYAEEHDGQKVTWLTVGGDW